MDGGMSRWGKIFVLTFVVCMSLTMITWCVDVVAYALFNAAFFNATKAIMVMLAITILALLSEGLVWVVIHRRWPDIL